jgi:hypothetical protein
VEGGRLQNDETQAITWNGRQDGDCQDQTGAVAPRYVREHGSILSLMKRRQRAEISEEREGNKAIRERGDVKK